MSASLRDKDCCLETCALHNCGAGWFNSPLDHVKIERQARQVGAGTEFQLNAFTMILTSSHQLSTLGPFGNQGTQKSKLSKAGT